MAHSHKHTCSCGHHHEHHGDGSHGEQKEHGHRHGCCEHDHHDHCDHHGHHDHCDHHGHHDHHDHHGHCACGHEHHDHGCDCGHGHRTPTDRELPVLLLGAGLFAAGVILEAFSLPGWPACLCSWFLLGLRIFLQAGKGLIRGHMLDENFLMGLATVAAVCIGQYTEAAGILLFYRAGEYFEHRAVSRSRKRIMDAVDMRPQTVTLEDGSVIPAENARPGDRLLIRPGDRIGLDSTVISGESLIDTAPITGEPMPAAVKPGDPLISGCINLQSVLTVRAEAPLSESMVTRILRAVEGAAAQKPQIQRFITRFARIYTPLVVAAALAVAVIPSLFTGHWSYWIYTAISFLVMSCPCALVLSVPLAFFCGIGSGSKLGILFRNGAAMEALSGVKVAALDKTGTVTCGQFRVQPCDEDLLALCAACEQHSSHPIAQSICARAKALGLSVKTPEAVMELPGMGVQAVLDGETILCGNAALMEQAGITPPAGAGTQVHLSKNGLYLGALTLEDQIKEDAAAAVSQLKKLGITPAMLTGDKEETAKKVARQLDIHRVYAQLLPEEKLTALKTLWEACGPVLFVGDGINDAPVLAGADVGAAMGSGADAAMEAADMVFLSSRTADIPKAVRLARRTRAVARQNVIFALSFKLAVMLLGLLGLANLWLAVFADSGVAALCVLNAIRLTKTK